MAGFARVVEFAPLTAIDVARGVTRLLFAEGFTPIVEFSLPNRRRLDVAALGPDGTVIGIEIKVSVADLRADDKWPDYLSFCDLFFSPCPRNFRKARCRPQPASSWWTASAAPLSANPKERRCKRRGDGR
jgi:hypothetical protein